MGMLGEMFPGPKIRDEAGEAGDGQPPFQLGPIDLENNTVVVHRAAEPATPQDEADRD